MTREADQLLIDPRPEELELVTRWLRRLPGRDLPAVYVEHNTPKGDVPNTRNPLAHRADIRASMLPRVIWLFVRS